MIKCAAAVEITWYATVRSTLFSNANESQLCQYIIATRSPVDAMNCQDIVITWIQYTWEIRQIDTESDALPALIGRTTVMAPQGEPELPASEVE